MVALYLFLIDVLALGPATSAAFALAYAFGTLAFPYSTLLYGHQPAAAFAFLGFAVLARSASSPPSARGSRAVSSPRAWPWAGRW